MSEKPVQKLSEEVAALEAEIVQLRADLEAERKKKGGIGLTFLAGKRRIVPF